MPGTELGPEDTVMNKTNKSPIFKSLHFSEERETKKGKKDGGRKNYIVCQICSGDKVKRGVGSREDMLRCFFLPFLSELCAS